jgi:hypothetical protein
VVDCAESMQVCKIPTDTGLDWRCPISGER